MTIKFLKDYETKANPPEVFTAGEKINDRGEASERHFVVRGVAAFVDDKGKLTDIEGNPVDDVAPEATSVPAKTGKGKPAPDAVMTSTAAKD